MKEFEDVQRGSRYVVNGRFLTRPTTGVDRYARELVHELDKLVPAGDFVLAIPGDSEVIDLPDLRNIEIVRAGKRDGILWEQLDLPNYLKRAGATGIHLCNTAPLVNPGIVCIHDMQIRANPSFFDWKFVAWYRFLFSFVVPRAKLILTVSEFSKDEIERFYPKGQGKVEVIANAWQHIERVETDEHILSKHPKLRNGSFYFAMSSLAPNKNLKWIAETARANPLETIVVAGGLNRRVFGKHAIPEAENVVYLGYVTDCEMKILMGNCKGFLFPTFYEGFGIPPMEALACGAPVAVSDASCMREVYGASAHYVDPNVPCADLGVLFSEKVKSAHEVLDRYSWQKSAQQLVALLEKKDGGF